MGPGIKKICLLLKQLSGPSLGDQLIAKARRLQRTASSPKAHEANSNPAATQQVTLPSCQGSDSQVSMESKPSSTPATKPTWKELWGDDEEFCYDISSDASNASDESEQHVVSKTPSQAESGRPAASAVPPSASSRCTVAEPFFDAVAKVCKRIWSDGRVQTAKMNAGATGFAIADFDGAEVQTEIPNLLLAPVPAAFKRPAALKAPKNDSKKKRKIATDSEELQEPTGHCAEEDDEQEDQSDGESELVQTPAVQTSSPKAKAVSATAVQTPSATAKAVSAKAKPMKGTPKTDSSASDSRMQYSMMRYPTGAYAFRQKLPPKKQIFQVLPKTMSADAFPEFAKQILERLNGGHEPESVKLWARGQA
jgi:hypothetical protein